MRVFDTSPLLRSAIGFDNVGRLLDSVARVSPSESAYPPYDIEKLGEDRYIISMAVAGFAEDELDVTVKDEVLIVSAKSVNRTDETDESEKAVYLHRGIAKRAFERRFQLADTIKVTGAGLENGLLHIDLRREIPEERKPRQIQINTAAGKEKAIEDKAA